MKLFWTKKQIDQSGQTNSNGLHKTKTGMQTAIHLHRFAAKLLN
jgi:hypothetical protein